MKCFYSHLSQASEKDQFVLRKYYEYYGQNILMFLNESSEVSSELFCMCKNYISVDDLNQLICSCNESIRLFV